MNVKESISCPGGRTGLFGAEVNVMTRDWKKLMWKGMMIPRSCSMEGGRLGTVVFLSSDSF